MTQFTTRECKQAIRAKYTSIGCYPLFLITSDGAALCVDCGRSEYRRINYAMRHRLNDGWRVTGSDVNWEDTNLYCDHCSEKIESAYGEETITHVEDIDCKCTDCTNQD